MTEGTRCRCECGYKCGGPGKCELWNKEGTEGMLECIEKHFVRDCDHDFSGPMLQMGRGCASIVCQKCRMAAITHDEWCGP